MNRSFIAAIVFLLLLVNSSGGQIPPLMNYQGRLLDSTGVPVSDGVYSLHFAIYDAPINGTQLWSSIGATPIAIQNGLFSAIIGGTHPLPDSLVNYNQLWLGVTVDLDTELQPRTPLLSTIYAFKSLSAQKVTIGRDLYHNVIDIGPQSSIRIPIVARRDNPTVTIYLYGEGFQGGLVAHTHTGVNSHAHDANGQTSDVDLIHDHVVTGTTVPGGQAHTHSGSTQPSTASHSHSASISSSGAHHHDFWFTGASNGLFLVHNGDYNGLAAHGEVQIRNASGSVTTLRSEHTHPVSIGSGGASHVHGFTTGGADANHSHSFSEPTTSDSSSHHHTITLMTDLFGDGLSLEGIDLNELLQNVVITIGETQVAGPFNGEFSSGSLDLSAHISGPGEHFIEIHNQGFSGGRIIYNVFVE